MRILIFHGYLLSGTGSNIYNARLAEALVALGHEVHLFSQDRHPEAYPFIAAAGDWDAGELRVRALPPAAPATATPPRDRPATPSRTSALGRAGSPSGPRDGDEPSAEGRGRCTVYRPDIGGLLPVYVADRYDGIEARTFADCSEEEVASYIDANVAAVREVVGLVHPEVALANHLVMGPVILARGLAGQVPYVVKVHGSALEYTVKPQPERFLGFAREGVAGARAILVGSYHTAASLWDLLEDPQLATRTRLGPPGVDLDRFVARDPSRARAKLRALTARLCSGAPASAAPAAQPGPPANGSGADVSGVDGAGVLEGSEDGFARDDAAAGRELARLDLERDRLVAFVGKLIVSKGVDLLLAAWPLVLERVSDARLIVVGFGAYRAGLENLLAALSVGELDRARQIALAGRALEAPGLRPPAAARPLRHLLAFLDGLGREQRERYLRAARALPEQVLFTGRLDHEELAELLPACEALVVPSTFPEAFGMVAVEAAACGALPISAGHSGLAEVSDALARAIPEQAAGWLSFPVNDAAVEALAERVVGWLGAEASLRSQTRTGLIATARKRWSWASVARGVIAAGRGELAGLQRP